MLLECLISLLAVSISIRPTSGTYVLIEMTVNSICEGYITFSLPAAVPSRKLHYVCAWVCVCVHALARMRVTVYSSV